MFTSSSFSLIPCPFAGSWLTITCVKTPNSVNYSFSLLVPTTLFSSLVRVMLSSTCSLACFLISCTCIVYTIFDTGIGKSSTPKSMRRLAALPPAHLLLNTAFLLILNTSLLPTEEKGIDTEQEQLSIRRKGAVYKPWRLRKSSLYIYILSTLCTLDSENR